MLKIKAKNTRETLSGVGYDLEESYFYSENQRLIAKIREEQKQQKKASFKEEECEHSLKLEECSEYDTTKKAA
jgi:hypothetical protein